MDFTSQTLRNWTGGRYSDPILVGAGGQATVWRAESAKSLAPVALKVFGRTARAAFYQELRVASTVQSPHLLDLIEFYQPEDHGLLVFDFCSGGSLRDLLDNPHPIGLRRVVRIGLHLSEALVALHSQNFAHGDVKPDNLLNRTRTRGDAWKLADLGVSVDERTGLRSFSRTLAYAAPEITLGLKTSAGDIWSLGVVIEEIMVRLPTEEGGNDKVERSLSELLKQTRRNDPAARPTAAECRSVFLDADATLRATRHLRPIDAAEAEMGDLPGEYVE